jgi:hypothetical protein
MYTFKYKAFTYYAYLTKDKLKYCGIMDNINREYFDSLTELRENFNLKIEELIN